MKKLLIAGLVLLTFNSNAQIKLIARADDIGGCRAANLGVIDSYKNGITSVVEVMVPAPWFNDAVKMINENPGLDVGIHMVLNSEWDNYRWRPLTPGKSIRDIDGYYHQTVFGGGLSHLLTVKLDMAEVEAEFRAQIETALKKIPQITHITEHMYYGNGIPALKTLIAKLAKEYNLGVEPDLSKNGVKNFAFPASGTFEDRKIALIAALNALKPGTYTFLAHPSVESIELSQFTIDGVAGTTEIDRINDHKLFTDPDVMQVIKDLNIELIGYRDILMSAPMKTVLVTPVDSILSTTTTIKFEWKPSYPAIENYQIDISASENFDTSYTDSTLTATKISLLASVLPQSHKLYWRVRAKNSKGWGEYSPTFTIINTLIATGKKTALITADGNIVYNSKTKTINFSFAQSTGKILFVTVNDLNGRKLLDNSLQKGIYNFELDASMLKCGIYIVTARNSLFLCSQKIVVE